MIAMLWCMGARCPASCGIDDVPFVVCGWVHSHSFGVGGGVVPDVVVFLGMHELVMHALLVRSLCRA